MVRMPEHARAVVDMTWLGMLPGRGGAALQNSANSAKVMPRYGGVTLNVPKMFGHLYVGADEVKRRFYADGTHPNNDGHAIIGTALANLVRDAVMPPPHVRHRQTVDLGAVKATTHALCTRAAHLASFVTSWGGWSLVDEAKGEEHRYGLVSNKSGQALVLTLNSSDGSSGSSATAAWVRGLGNKGAGAITQKMARLWVEVGFLKSYGNWGGFDVECPAACACSAAGPGWFASWLSNKKNNPLASGVFPHTNTKHADRVSIRYSTNFVVSGPRNTCMNELALVLKSTDDAKVKILDLNLFADGSVFFH